MDEEQQRWPDAEKKPGWGKSKYGIVTVVGIFLVCVIFVTYQSVNIEHKSVKNVQRDDISIDHQKKELKIYTAPETQEEDAEDRVVKTKAKTKTKKYDDAEDKIKAKLGKLGVRSPAVSAIMKKLRQQNITKGLNGEQKMKLRDAVKKKDFGGLKKMLGGAQSHATKAVTKLWNKYSKMGKGNSKADFKEVKKVVPNAVATKKGVPNALGVKKAVSNLAKKHKFQQPIAEKLKRESTNDKKKNFQQGNKDKKIMRVNGRPVIHSRKLVEKNPLVQKYEMKKAVAQKKWARKRKRQQESST